MIFRIITLFPECFEGFVHTSVLGRSLQKGLWTFSVYPLRNYGIGKHARVDDYVYGGGPGMLIRADVLDAALTHACEGLIDPMIVFFTPRGEPLSQNLFKSFSLTNQELILLCARYEGIDERIFFKWPMKEISLGDFVLCGGELPAMVFIEGSVRLIDTVLGNQESVKRESFEEDLLEYPQYTKPCFWNGLEVPSVLRSGHHKKINQWRQSESEKITQQKRPDLWKKYQK